jgi:pyruvate dehydrogenase (quinone)/pyruvate oxidase
MAKIASELLIERLLDWGIDAIFGLPGDGIFGIMEGLRRNQERMQFLLVQPGKATIATTLFRDKISQLRS